MGKVQRRIVAMIIATGILAACSQNEIEENDGVIGNNSIRFGMTATAVVEPAMQSRAATEQEAYDPLLLLNEACDTLYLHTAVAENPIPETTESAETRGVPVSSTTNNFATAHGAFGVTALLNGTEYMSDVKVGSYSGGIWSPSDEAYYWPGTRTLDFYAHAPYTLRGAKGGEKTFAAGEIDYADGKITFDYTVPRWDDGGTPRDAEMQPDLMFAGGSYSLATSNSGKAPLHFSHALAGVRFVANDIAGGTIRSIAIKMVSGSGSCVYDVATQQFAWAPTDEPTNRYRQTFDVAVRDATSGEQSITDAKPETTFMMLPQTLSEEASIEVELETANDGVKVLTGRIGANGVKKWEAGKVYTYIISTNSINWTYFFEVTESVTLKDGQVSSSYKVTSYKQRTNDPTTKEAVAWTAEPAEEVGRTDVPTFSWSGAGSTAATSYGLKCRPLDLLMSTWPGDMEVLRKAEALGSAEAPYDLSTKGGTEKRNTANCYLVHAAGTYRLPLVYGNAIKNGATNSAAYTFTESSSTIYLQKFKRASGGNITQPYITNDSKVTSCKLVWQDAIDVIRDVKLATVDGEQCLVFTINPVNLVQTNAVVAACDSSGTIVWSWHIWVTENDPNDETQRVKIDDYDNSSLKYDFFPKHIGWCDSKTLIYKSRQTDIVFTQKESNAERQLAVVQTQYEFTNFVNNGVYYQWGRKDPIIGICDRSVTSVKPYYIDNEPQSKVIYKAQGSITLQEGIKNPQIMYAGASKQHWTSNVYKNLWNNRIVGYSNKVSVKTVYDPSPGGFKLATKYTYRVFSTDGSDHQYSTVPVASSSFYNYFNGDYDYASNPYSYIAYSKKNKNKNATKIDFETTGERYYASNLTWLKPTEILNPSYVYIWTSDASRFTNSTHGYFPYTVSFALGYTPNQEAAVWVTGDGYLAAPAMARPAYCIVE